jgi:hypothetical protein
MRVSQGLRAYRDGTPGQTRLPCYHSVHQELSLDDSECLLHLYPIFGEML